MNQKPPFPDVIDSTLLGTFRSCPQKAFRTYIEHWKPKTESVHLVAGKAFAAGIEQARRCFFEMGMDAETSVAHGLATLLKSYGDFNCPSDSPKSLERMCGALEFYFSIYPLAKDLTPPIILPDGSSGIEMSFLDEIPITHPQTGNALHYVGHADLVAHFAGGIYGFDEKTTSNLGNFWARQWEHRSQFTGYAWALREQGINVAGWIVRGVSILKNSYGNQEVLTYRAGWEIDRWYVQMLRDVRRMIEMWETGYWDYNLDHACAEYGGCPLTSVCKSPDPLPWLKMYFEKRVWDSQAKEEISYEEWARKKGIPV